MSARASRLLLPARDELRAGRVATLGRELRAPLATLLGEVDALLARNVAPEMAARLTAMRRHGASLIDALEQLVKGGTRRDVAPPRGWAASGLREAVEADVSDYRPLARQRGVRLWTDLHASVHEPLHFDSPRVRAVLRTLVASSLGRASDGGWVGVRAHLEGPGLAAIEVLDTGPALGQPEFERLAREPHAGSTDADGGSGLATARAIARSLGGSIEHERTPTSRNLCRFRFALRPAKRVGRTSVGVRPPRGHVLLIDGCADTRQSIRRGLEQAGAVVSVAVNGRVGVDAALDGSFDLVLVDLATPGTDGWTAMAALRYADYATPVVALCKLSPKFERRRIFDAGFAELIAHPVDRRALLGLAALHLPGPGTQWGSGLA